MNYNNGFEFLAGMFTIISFVSWARYYMSERHDRWPLIPTVLTLLTLIFGFLYTIGAGK